MFYTYILRSKKTNKLYKGVTTDLRNRIERHNAGKIKSTKHDRPWELLHYQAFKNKTDARREELFLKTGQGRERIKYLLKDTLTK